MSLKILGVLMVNGFGVTSDDNLRGFLIVFSNSFCLELDFPLGCLDEIEKDDVSEELILLILSLCTYLNRSFSE
ncbi:hypothetical protein RCL_jg599.t1 [Rhizophagus clarus]|uniref:Uncharacterized protein n=1 Tax=Rhizophagus clarus TaxID=94130 RepID=A0A8H3LN68_9GLOM|nr:hypothetical protein RCL_jg599.t1 [Rhizophagus clarus]